MTIRIHRVGADDEALFEHIAPDVFDRPIQRNRLRAFLAAPSHLMLLAVETTRATRSEGGGESARRIVGQCSAVLHQHPDKPAELYVDELGTASTHRRQGIGRRLMLAMLDWGREIGCSAGWLATEHDNLAANRLYESSFGAGEKISVYEFAMQQAADSPETES